MRDSTFKRKTKENLNSCLWKIELWVIFFYIIFKVFLKFPVSFVSYKTTKPVTLFKCLLAILLTAHLAKSCFISI